MKSAIIFGGTGFIGGHFADFLAKECLFDKVVLADYALLDDHPLLERLNSLVTQGIIEIIHCDVRSKIEIEGKFDLIVNLAAIHREPGHENNEYYETNIPGAENVCDFASRIGCNNIIFTSSIAVYGEATNEKTERSTPCPISAYGGSKLAAEFIHKMWQSKEAANNLLIVRPGVVFGAGEGGNVSRLIKALLKRYFVFVGNQNTRKAGIYVKELCNAMWWRFGKLSQSNNGVAVTNMTMKPAPSMQEYVAAINSANSSEIKPLALPFKLILWLSTFINAISSLLKISQPINPTRVRKMCKSNNIVPYELSSLDYEYRYTLNSAMEDWKKNCSEEW